MTRRPPTSTLFPYTTLFRSHRRLRTPAALRRHRSAPHGWTAAQRDRKSTRLNSSHTVISYAVFCLKKKKTKSLLLLGTTRQWQMEVLTAEDVSNRVTDDCSR